MDCIKREECYIKQALTDDVWTKFKMGQIGVEDLELMAADESRAERCSAAKKVLGALRDGT